MEPKRPRLSEFSSISSSSLSSSSIPSRGSFSSPDVVLHISTVSTESIPPIAENGNNTFQVPAPLSDKSNPSRQSFVTTSSGTSVWTGQGSSRTKTTAVTSSCSSVGTTNSIDTSEEVIRGTIANAQPCYTPDKDVIVTYSTPNSYSPTKPAVIAIADDTEELPPTQPEGPLKGVIAYVEVYSGADNRSAVVGNVLRDLGAVVNQRFTNVVTHIVFREGRQSTLERARLRNVHLVQVSWVDVCQRENRKASESEHALPRLGHGTPQTLWRSKRIRSMQPKPREAELLLTDDCIRKRKQRLEASRLKKQFRDRRFASEQPTSWKKGAGLITPPVENPVLPAASSTNSGNVPSGNDTPDSLRRQVAHVRKKIFDTATDSPGTGRDSSSDEEQEETLGNTIRKQLFGVGGPLHGSPIPDFLDRSRSRSTTTPGRLAENKATVNGHFSGDKEPKECKEGEANASSGGKKVVSKIEEVILSVCEKVRRMNLVTTSVSGQSRRRIFDADSDRLSDRMDTAMEKNGDCSAEDISKSSTMEVVEAFGIQPDGDPTRKTKRQRKKKGEDSLIRLRSSTFQIKSSSECIQQTQAARRSSEDFQKKTVEGKRKTKKTGKKETKTQQEKKEVKPAVPSPAKRKEKRVGRIVLTNVKTDDRKVIRAITHKLKGFRLDLKVTADTSHVICGENRRTLSVLFGVARGCWMLPVEWAYDSLAQGRWLNEEDYELCDQFPSARVVRQGKNNSACGGDPLITCRLFSGTGPFYVNQQSTPPATEIRSLIRWCGGKVVLTSRRAGVCVGCEAAKEGAISVKETWVLDSIMEQRLLPTVDYAMD